MTVPFLKVTANQISNWSQTVCARTRFAVFLRTLVNSTCTTISRVDFPGNDDGERRGWDGKVECRTGNSWVPDGTSGWEFSTTASYSTKANKDYKKSIDSGTPENRKEITFIFVTPHRWEGKSKWEEKRRDERNWKDVRVYDASDLEQWLEQSLPGQAWFANEIREEHEGILSLDRCWEKWNAKSDPSFTEDIFAEAISTTGVKLVDRLRKEGDRVVRLVAESILEGLAFLHVLFNQNDSRLAEQRDRIVVFTKPGPLAKLAVKTSHFTPVITDREVEIELSETGQKIGGIVITSRTTYRDEKDIVLEPLSDEAFHVGLEKMGVGRDDVTRLIKESGRSLTVLRRRISKDYAIRCPEWSSCTDLPKFLFPTLLAGAWDSRVTADQNVICELAGIARYSDFDLQFTKLRDLNESPVWMVRGYCGVVSKFDGIHAICGSVGFEDLRRFYAVAKTILSPRSPWHNLPEGDRYAAHIYDSSGNVSNSLRDGITDSLALMSMVGKKLFFDRTGVDPENLCSKLIEGLLEPLDADLLKSQAFDLPIYAEAAPNTFLEILEKDLENDEPVVFSLFRPVGTSLFEKNPSTSLLCALEILAWSELHLPRVLGILRRLCENKLDNSRAKEPDETLRSIFRSWLPQTGVTLERRKYFLKQMIDDYPDMAWIVCKAELDPSQGFASPNHRPRWRDYAHGHGRIVTNKEHNEFVLFCLELALNMEEYDLEVLGDLIGFEFCVSEDYNIKIWDVVNGWAQSASDADRATLREKIRTTVHRSLRGEQREGCEVEIGTRRRRRIKDTYDALEPHDLVQKHLWLFKTHWAPEVWYEIDEELDYQKKDERKKSLRVDATRQVYRDQGFKGIIDLALLGESAWIVGRCFGAVLTDIYSQGKFVDFIIPEYSVTESFAVKQLVESFFAELGAGVTCSILELLHKTVSDEVLLELYCVAPFEMATWAEVERFDAAFQNTYWMSVIPHWMHHSEKDLGFATEKLLDQRRPTAAFNFIQLDLRSIAPSQLYQVLLEMTTSNEDPCTIQSKDSFSIKKAISLLTERDVQSQSQLALLEFRYLALYGYKDEVPNLEMEVSQNPSIFCYAVEMAYKRDDGKSDNDNIEDQETSAANAHRMLDALKRIPGSSLDGKIDADDLEQWISKVRKLCEMKGRRGSADYRVGKLLSKAKKGTDELWPCESVRSVMDRLMTDDISDGFYSGTTNSRSAFFRKIGGPEERAFAKRYSDWASLMEYEYPYTAGVLQRIARFYERYADYEDNKAAIRKHLRY